MAPKKKSAPKKAAKKAAAKKTLSKPVKAAPKKKAPVKKAAAKKAAPKKKAPVKKVVAKKAPAPKKKAVAKKKAPARKKTVSSKANPKLTTIIASVDVGYGNELFIRGEGSGLSWDAGTPMTCISSETWSYTTDSATAPIEYKVLINDSIWSEGDNFSVAPGEASEISPSF